MRSTDLTTRPSLCSLPIEVKQAILCHIRDLHTLKAAILSHPNVYSAFLGGKELIALRVLLNVIPHGLLPEMNLILNGEVLNFLTMTRTGKNNSQN